MRGKELSAMRRRVLSARGALLRHPWASRGVVSADELSEQMVLLREVGSSTRQVTKRAFEYAGDSGLGRLEGLNVATDFFKPHVMPMAVAILVVLFAAQSRGTASIGWAFGPVMLIWFVTIAVLGLGVPLVTFVVFERWFLVPMPKGPLEAWLGF